MKNSQYDLEQGIMICWNVVEDLKSIAVFNRAEPLTSAETSELLTGLANLYHIKFCQLFSGFEDLIHNREL
jgi:hypothetical protein